MMRIGDEGLAEFAELCEAWKLREKARREERARARRDRRQGGPEARRAGYVKGAMGRYGLTEAELVALFRASAGMCAICGKRFTPDRGAVIDHDHATGKVRGLLCVSCNAMLGFAHDDGDTLQAATDYLSR